MGALGVALMISDGWEHFPHEADIGVRGIGATREAAFEQAALALSAVIVDLNSVDPIQAILIAARQ